MAKEKKKSNLLLNTFVLGLVSAVLVLCLAVVNQVTMGPIEQAEINARAEAYKAVYPNAQAFAEVDDTEKLIEGSGEVLSKAGLDGCSINDVLAVTDTSNNIKGYVVSATSPNGYGGDVQVAVGIEDGKLTGFDVISHGETPGFGAKCTEDEFKTQFAGKSAEFLSYSKTGAQSDTEFDAISGATITSNAVQEAVNAAIAFYQASFGGGIVEEEEVDPLVKAYPEANLEELEDVDVVETKTDDYMIDFVKKTADGGYLIASTAHNGYDGDLQIALGIDKDGVITGFSTIVCNETKALGGQCTSDEYGKQFAGLQAKEVKFVQGGNANHDNNEIDAIASATITTNATITAVNGAVEYYNANLKGE